MTIRSNMEYNLQINCLAAITSKALACICYLIVVRQQAKTLRYTRGLFYLVWFMSKKADITGQRFGSMTAIKKIAGMIWLFQCDCGESEQRNRRYIQKSSSDGCRSACKKCFSTNFAARSSVNNKTHGLSQGATKKLYDVYRQMMRRCYDNNCKDYKNYGARCISVCYEWHDVPGFVKWAIASGYKEGVTIERIDVNGGYCPENCTWIENKYQARNTRKASILIVDGEPLQIGYLAEKLGISVKTIKGRINRGWSVDEIINIAPKIGNNQAVRAA